MKGKNIEEISGFRQKYQINQFVCLYSERGVEQLAEIISCRVQLAQFALLRESGSELTWEEYLLRLCASEENIMRARRVALEAQRDFGAFDFEHPAQQCAPETAESVYAVRLFEGEQAEGIVVLFEFRAELAHYRALLKERGDGYTLAQYMQELWTDEELAAAQRKGFEAAVDSLDFNAAWRRIGFEFF